MIKRILRGETSNGPIEINQSDLSARSESLIILGEAGMGKTELTVYLGKLENFSRCTARQLINRPDPKDLLLGAKVLVIDALDEVGAQKDGEAVDLVLQKLGQLGYPRFIMSCRVSDWRSATGRSVIRDQYGSEPLELKLSPFTPQDVLSFLQDELDQNRAKEVVEHFQKKGIADLLGNPQTLLMIARVAKDRPLPSSIGALFDSFVELAWHEHSDLKPSSTLLSLGSAPVYDALGAAYCALIVTGSEAISRLPRHLALEFGDLPLADVAELPSAAVLPKILDSRLVHPSTTPERFTYPHRRIGEFLGARWLVRQASTARKRRRLLSQFRTHGLVPASLRGIHSWLAWHDHSLANAVIDADPMGLIEYGDADDLTVEQGKALIASMEAWASRDPSFAGWGTYSVRGIVQTELIDDLRRVITAPDIPFGLRLLVLNGVAGSPVATLLAEHLEKTLLDADAAYVFRSAAGEALTKIDQGNVWPQRLESLQKLADESSLRLALQLLGNVGYSVFGDQLIAQLICAEAGISLCQFPKSDRDRTTGLFYRLQRELPDDRLEGVLNLLSESAAAFLTEDHDPYDDFKELYLELVARSVTTRDVDPMQLWNWLKPIKNELGLRESARASLALALKDDDQLRRAVQKKVLLQETDEKNVWQRAFGLIRRSSGFAVTPEDAIELISQLGNDDLYNQRWKDLVSLVRHSNSENVEVRNAAKTFIQIHNGSSSDIEWIDELCNEKIQEWQIQEAKRREKEAKRRSRDWEQHRIEFGKHINEMRRGDYGLLLSPAKAYLKLFSDIGDDVPAHERIPLWLGDELASAAYAGFEAFLLNDVTKPTADEISESHAEGKHWDVGYILVSGLAERFRAGRAFTDLGEEKIISGLYELFQHRIDAHAGIEGLSEAVEQEVKQRKLWPAAIKRWIEPQLRLRKTHVDNLYELMTDDVNSDLAAELAAEWLSRYPDMRIEAEIPMTDRLIHSNKKTQLIKLADSRLKIEGLDDERYWLWSAVAILVDFEAAIARLHTRGPIERSLIWHIRARFGHRRGGRGNVELQVSQIVWIVSNFRRLWPSQPRPSGVTIGDNNPWDATEYLRELIDSLGNFTSDEATAAIAELSKNPPDGYTTQLQIVTWEQARKKVEYFFVPLTLKDLSSLVYDDAPTQAASLQAVLIEEIAVLQSQLSIGGDALEPHRGFYGVDKPHDEEDCRDYLMLLLRERMPFGIVLRPEGHAARDKEIDIECSLGQNLMIPIEIKGQWHKELWHAADTQLARLYSTDWRSDRRGIYLVLWFGDKGKPLKNPPNGLIKPLSPSKLREILISQSKAAQEGLVEIVVLDLTRQ